MEPSALVVNSEDISLLDADDESGSASVTDQYHSPHAAEASLEDTSRAQDQDQEQDPNQSQS